MSHRVAVPSYIIWHELPGQIMTSSWYEIRLAAVLPVCSGARYRQYDPTLVSVFISPDDPAANPVIF